MRNKSRKVNRNRRKNKKVRDSIKIQNAKAFNERIESENKSWVIGDV